MKKILTTALAVVLMVGAAQAQTGERGHRKHGGKWATELNLTVEQKAKLQTVREAQRAEMETLRKSGSATPEQREAIHEKYKAQYDAILTPAQKDQLKKQKEQWKAHRKDDNGQGARRHHRGNKEAFGQQAAIFKKELNLSAQQETKLNGLLTDYRAKAKTIRTDNKLSAQEQKQQLRLLTADYMSQGKAVLNAEQLQKLESMRDRRKARHHRNR